jgi:hypothetical protein
MEAVLAFISNPVIRDISFGTLVVLAVILIMTGRLVPRATHERELATANKRGDEWKETALKGRELIEEQSRQLGKFAEASKTPAEFFGTVMRSGGDTRVASPEPSES